MAKSSPLLVAQITDTHLYAEVEQELMGVATNDTLQAVLARLSQLPTKPDTLLLTGDLSQDESCKSYQRLQDLLAPLEIPTYWIPGNHDRLENMQQALKHPVAADKYFTAGGWHFLLLDSQSPGCVHGKLAQESLEWLEQKLQQIGDRPTLIALHHPPCLIGSDWLDKINLRNSEDFFAVTDRYPHIKLVVFGHIHQEFDGMRRGVRYLGSPSTCAQFKPTSEGFSIEGVQPGFRLLTLMPDGTYETRIERANYRSLAQGSV